MLDPIKRTLQVNMNYASAEEHVPTIDHSNQTLKEHIHSGFHALPYTAIPKLMITVLVLESTKKLN